MLLLPNSRIWPEPRMLSLKTFGPEPPMSISKPLPGSNVFMPDPPKKSSLPVVPTNRFAPEPPHATVWRPVSFSKVCARDAAALVVDEPNRAEAEIMVDAIQVHVEFPRAANVLVRDNRDVWPG